MRNNFIKYWLDSSYLVGSNRSYIEQLYNCFLKNPNSVDLSWKLRFDKFSDQDPSLKSFEDISGSSSDSLIPLIDEVKQCKYQYQDVSDNFFQEDYNKIRLLQFIDDFRRYGHQYANLDPLKLSKKRITKSLDLCNYNFTNSDFQKFFNVDFLNFTSRQMQLIDLYDFFKKIYCKSIGIEYMHINNINEIEWIKQKIELQNSILNFDITEKKRILNELISSESVEKYLGIKFPAAKRFSLEGGDVIIPMLKEIIRQASKNGIKEIIIGMAHRGRLNVLVNVLGKPMKILFDEFLNQNVNGFSGSGDVKYHAGFSSSLIIEGNLINLSLVPNPSHLEIVSPVVMGITRAKMDDNITNITNNIVLPITLHGDAAFSGQGIVQETLNMSKVPAYDVNGSIRIIINNQIGFTTSNIEDLRSTEYCTDIAKMLQIPVFHVNADDPEAAVMIARIALDFRNTFKKDVLIDLVCYRRHGHNETDEPSATQPLMYKSINQHLSVIKIYSNKLENDKVIESDYTTKIVNNFREKIKEGNCLVQECKDPNIYCSILLQNDIGNDFCYELYPNKISVDYLQKLSSHINTIPIHIEMHPRVSKIYHDRYDMSQGIKKFDWGGAEILAYATLINNGISVRLSGEDSARGTFFHRHAVIHDQNSNNTYIPLKYVCRNQGKFYVWNSVLSEEATLAFEYGYANQAKSTIVIWEAQFGDFTNGAQIVIDQFISSSEQKWGELSSLVMLLPHGYEGQGPEHSSARLERYLQLCSQNNMQICLPTTAAQFYHLLRRQAICNIRKPLIVMSPKSLLRNNMASSCINELANGTFNLVIEELDNDLMPDNVTKLIICTGKIYYELAEQRKKNEQYNVAILRIEQLYPFPTKELKKILLNNFINIKKIIWCQEEPKNQGAWMFCRSYLYSIIPKNILIEYVGRADSASPATGLLSIHQDQQKKIINDALLIS